MLADKALHLKRARSKKIFLSIGGRVEGGNSYSMSSLRWESNKAVGLKERETMMSSDSLRQQDALSSDEMEVRSLYHQMLDGWNKHNADAFAAPFAEDGEVIGFDGSQMNGRAEIAATLGQIFADHVTAPYVSKVKSVRLLSSDVAILRAIVGMVPPGQSDLNPAVNAHQTLVAVKRDGIWRIELLQTTPAQFHGRPELVEQMTEELRQVLK
jgi:uncharacterized protein (TIGR02246 family)